MSYLDTRPDQQLTEFSEHYDILDDVSGYLLFERVYTRRRRLPLKRLWRRPRDIRRATFKKPPLVRSLAIVMTSANLRV